MLWLARSANEKTRSRAQTYPEHVSGARSISDSARRALAPFVTEERRRILEAIVRRAVEFHDLGKLDEENQKALRRGGKAHLPWPHADAGTAFLLKQEEFLSAILVYAHHQGLPDFIVESNRGEDCFRIRDDQCRRHTDRHLAEYLERHGNPGICASGPPDDEGQCESPDLSMFLRIALSLLVDGDHANSANHEKCRPENFQKPLVDLRPRERLEALDRHVDGLRKDSGERTAVRSRLYDACRDADRGAAIVACDSPVGTGKTTAVMANLLRQAEKRGLRRIFVVLPFTNIITQSVKTYREALALPGEDPNEVVAEVHHRADFKDETSREFAVQWRAPIIVTTAVAFFETMASNHPSALRRLHNLPGSAVFIDEAHASLPVRLLPLAWIWINQFAERWSVYWVLASGSLNRFWEIPEISNGNKVDVPDLADPRQSLLSRRQERDRIQYLLLEDPLSIEDLLERVAEAPGSRLLVVNTVRTAAVIAKRFEDSHRFDQVLHISTALTPVHREEVLRKVKDALGNPGRTNWILIGTSCIEAGLDFSFRSGFREMASLVSLLQFSGRVNRSCEESHAPVYSFSFQEDPLLNANPELDLSVRVLKGLFEDGKEISADLCTEAMRKEIRMMVDPEAFQNLARQERLHNFPEVDRTFRVIPYEDSRTVVVTPETILALEAHTLSDWQEVQRNSVQLRGCWIEKLGLQTLAGCTDIYKWADNYDPLIGCMGKVLELLEIDRAGCCFLDNRSSAGRPMN